MHEFNQRKVPVKYIAIGRKGRDMLIRRRKDLIAEFSNLPAAPSFADVSAIGRLAVEEFLTGRVDRVYLVYTDFVNMVRQTPTMKQLLPLEFDSGVGRVEDFSPASTRAEAAYIYEPGEAEILDNIVPRFTALQVYQAVMESLASEHAARMVAMKSASDNAGNLIDELQLVYNKARQAAITQEISEIVGGAAAV
jgi:F-type H+-transporting ATPase subunit gamma